MYKDKIVDEVRKNREKIFKDFGYDMKKYSAYIIEKQKGRKGKLISEPFYRNQANVI